MKPNRTRVIALLFLVALLSSGGCQAINGALGIKPTDTATDQRYKLQNTYNALVTGIIQLRINRVIPDDVYTNTFLPARRAAFQALTDLKPEAEELTKQGKQLDTTSVAFRALDAALNQMSLLQAQHKPLTGASNGPGNNSGNSSGSIDPDPNSQPTGSQQPSDINPGATPSD